MDATDRKLLARIQCDFPLEPRPFARLAQELGLDEQEVISRLAALRQRGIIRRIGPVLDPEKTGRVGALAAMSVPPDRLAEVAAAVSACSLVTHNYERRPLPAMGARRHGACPFNLWFTLTAGSSEALEAAVGEIQASTGVPVTLLPVRRKFKIGVKFDFAGDSDG